MWARLHIAWATIRDSLWFLPAILTLLAAALATFLVRLERTGRLVFGDADHWLVGAGAEGARGVLSAIAGGLITVTGVVFSVTIVALQLASSQFTPRVLRNFTADRSNQLVLGVFIGTFTYALLVLRVVRSPTDTEEAFIPRVAVAVAVLLVLVSIGFLIFFIDHAARSIQISQILERVTRRSLQQVERLFPATVGRAEAEEAVEAELGSGGSTPVSAARGGYLQAVDGNALFELGQTRQLVIRMQPRIGMFVLPGQALARVWPGHSVDDEVVQQIRRAFVLGSQRTPEQDVEFGIIEVSDIAVKALSPGINDPTTALVCIDRLAEILVALGNRRPPADVRTDEGHVHFVACHTTYTQAVSLAFDQIRHYGEQNPAIRKKLLEAAQALLALVPEGRHAPLRELADGVASAVPGRSAVIS